MPVEITMQSIIALSTLMLMEIVLGIDNIVFIAILVARLPERLQSRARSIGIALALFMRIGLLFSISWLMSLNEDLFSIFGKGFSGRDLILLGGGVFLIGKSTTEIHHKVEGENAGGPQSKMAEASMMFIISQIILLDLVFSLDSVITAVGMVKEIWIMVTAMVIAMIVMLATAGRISRFIEAHPTVKILALSFLMLIGFMLVVEGTGTHINKGYVYFAMFFSLVVELLNIRYRLKRNRIGVE